MENMTLLICLPLGLDMPISTPGYGKNIFGENLIQIMQVLTVLLDTKIWIQRQFGRI